MRCNHQHQQVQWGTRRKSHEAKVKFRYNNRSPANTAKQVCPSISIKVWTFLISCKLMVFLSICFLLCYGTVTMHFFCKNNKIISVDNNCFLTSRLKLLFFIDLVTNIRREFVHSFISFQTRENNASLVMLYIELLMNTEILCMWILILPHNLPVLQSPRHII